MGMTILIVLLTAAQAYLLGSIDTGILVSKYLYHDDVRNHGSGAAGMTNMLRTFGKKAAAMTAAGDVLKGVAAVCIGRWLFHYLPADAVISPYLGTYLAAILVVIGHLKPIYFHFKGGKGVLTAGGTILAIQPILLPFLTLIFLICLLPTGMVSLGSVVMAALYPVLTLIYGIWLGMATKDLVVCTLGAAVIGGMVVYMHRSNIQRIREGKEYRFFGPKKTGKSK
ncbi:MAG: glycerol-3-phosphate 1-O-acyltransferase PlsY [Faecalibacterium sp.]